MILRGQVSGINSTSTKHAGKQQLWWKPLWSFFAQTFSPGDHLKAGDLNYVLDAAIAAMQQFGYGTCFPTTFRRSMHTVTGHFSLCPNRAALFIALSNRLLLSHVFLYSDTCPCFVMTMQFCIHFTNLIYFTSSLLPWQFFLTLHIRKLLPLHLDLA